MKLMIYKDGSFMGELHLRMEGFSYQFLETFLFSLLLSINDGMDGMIHVKLLLEKYCKHFTTICISVSLIRPKGPGQEKGGFVNAKVASSTYCHRNSLWDQCIALMAAGRCRT